MSDDVFYEYTDYDTNGNVNKITNVCNDNKFTDTLNYVHNMEDSSIMKTVTKPITYYIQGDYSHIANNDPKIHKEDNIKIEIDTLVEKLNTEQSKYIIKKLLKKNNINRIRCHTHNNKKPDMDLNNIFILNLFSQLKRLFHNSISGSQLSNSRLLIEIYNKQYLNFCNSMCKDCIIEYSANNPLVCSHGLFMEIRCCNICQRLTLNCYSCRNVIFKCNICEVKCCRKCILDNYIVNNTDQICKNCTYSILHTYFEPDMEKIINKYKIGAASSI